MTYDAGGRITGITDVDGTTTSAYDDAGQLTAVTHTGATPAESFTYDLAGNRVGAATEFGLANRVLDDGEYRYEYDDEDNLARRVELVGGVPVGAAREFAYDHRNRLVAVIDLDADGAVTQTVTYVYDPLDRRIAKIVDATPADGVAGATTHFVYDKEDVALEFSDVDGSGPGAAILAMRYLHGPGYDQVLAQEDYLTQDPTLRVLWLLADHIGSVRDLVDNAGAVMNHIIYDAFGRVIFETNPAVSSRYGFTGREYDKETGVLYLRARYYDPRWGRFLNEDLVRFALGDSNLYPYVNNNPVSHTDPTGLHTGFEGVDPRGKAFLVRLFFVKLIGHVELHHFETPGDVDIDGEIIPSHREQMSKHIDQFGGRINEEGPSRWNHQIGAAEWLLLAAVGLLAGGRVAQLARERKKRKRLEEPDDDPLHVTPVPA